MTDQNVNRHHPREVGEGDDPGAATEEAISESDKGGEHSGSPIVLTTRVIFVACLVFFTWHLFADRLTPFTDQGRIKTLLVPVVPRVSGYVTRISVQLHAKVAVNQILFQIDPQPYRLAVQQAEGNLDNVLQQVNAQTESIKSAAGRVGIARAQLDRSQRYYDRIQVVLQSNPGALSQADVDLAETSLDQAEEGVLAARADLEKTRKQLGASGKENPQFRSALAALEQARMNLEFTEVRAMSEGVIENLNQDIGFFAQAGVPLAELVSVNNVWLEAYMRENNLYHLKKGDPVELSLDVLPGQIIKGKVNSIGSGVSTTFGGTNHGSLPSVSGPRGWLRDPQRFPVIITFDTRALQENIRSGGQADVIIYTGEYPLLNLIGSFLIRLNSLLSYVR